MNITEKYKIIKVPPIYCSIHSSIVARDFAFMLCKLLRNKLLFSASHHVISDLNNIFSFYNYNGNDTL
jgi:hypothetical protein